MEPAVLQGQRDEDAGDNGGPLPWEELRVPAGEMGWEAQISKPPRETPNRQLALGGWLRPPSSHLPCSLLLGKQKKNAIVSKDSILKL